ncbi:serine hydrolase domain-containing protein [Streptomyces candidus]|uniref:CubicO group peptidase (Beta-lactamase class C family) n=1 Tax=Streptomyces candidus TaxID=67283 RepID=A0A7X0HK97_9ACTN|nr:serine hydrolase domain-containing protein [Streptomyces candidus]MBB6437929.1 CubicO group peptidase (beta-lactamase class C family) [Streptomyces candidus]
MTVDSAHSGTGDRSVGGQDGGNEGGGRRGVTRRYFAGGAAALGGALMLGQIPVAGATETDDVRGARHRPTLRYGSAARAGLLPAHLDRLVEDARGFLGPSPEHPWYAGAVLLAGRGGTVALHEPIGYAVRYSAYDEKSGTAVEFPPERQIPMARDTVFDLASVSKLFTSMLAVQQIERGALDLEAEVASYLPEFGRAGKGGITVRQLLTHTSGFRAWIPLYLQPTREGKLEMLWNETPANPPGTTYLYSDLNLISLQLVLEEITARSLDTLLREEITAPLGMRRTRFNPPADWKPGIAATEDARKPWSGIDRGLVWGEVHDENAYGFGGVAGHAGVFSTAWDLAVLARTLLNGGVYGRARILREESVELMFTDFNTDFPGDEHGLGFELHQHWYMGAMATPRTAGHTGFTGTSLVIDPTTDSFLIVLGNSVHPVRSWRSGSAPRVATANDMARAVAVRPAQGRTAWFSGMASAATATLSLPVLPLASGRGLLRCDLWWDVEPSADTLALEASADAGATWQPVPFTTVRRGGRPEPHPGGAVTGWSGRLWHRAGADLGPYEGKRVTLRWRYTTDARYVGRGVYVDGLRVTDGDRTLFDEKRPRDAARIEAAGWTASAD